MRWNRTRTGRIELLCGNVRQWGWEWLWVWVLILLSSLVPHQARLTDRTPRFLMYIMLQFSYYSYYIRLRLTDCSSYYFIFVYCRRIGRHADEDSMWLGTASIKGLSSTDTVTHLSIVEAMSRSARGSGSASASSYYSYNRQAHTSYTSLPHVLYRYYSSYRQDSQILHLVVLILLYVS